MASRALIIAAVVVAALACVKAQPVASTLLDPKNSANGCYPARFNAVITRYYANDTACANLITQAMNETVPAECPGGNNPYRPGSQVHLCMNKNNTKSITDAWSDFLRNCEVMYIANRGGQGESEEGFTYQQNSCFPTFNSFNEFQGWLTDARPYGGQQLVTSAASSVRIAISSIFAAVAFAFIVMWS